MHNNNLFDKTLMYSRSKFCPQKTPIRRTVKKEQSRLSFKTATFFLDLHIVPKAFDDMIYLHKTSLIARVDSALCNNKFDI